MKLINSVGPNPHVVRMFMAERGITLPLEDIDILKGQNREGDYLKTNAAGQTPTLVLDDGSVVTEILAICEYLDEKFPGASLIGATPEERAQTRRWTRWVDLNVVEHLTNGFRFSEGLPLFQNRFRCVPEAAPGLKAKAQDGLAFLDAQLATRTFIAGEKFTVADVLLFCFQAFGNAVGQPLNPELKNVSRWFAEVSARPSAKA